MYRIAIVEDEKECQDTLLGHIKRYEKKAVCLFRQLFFSDGLDILDPYKPEWDIIFLDIRMKWIDGMETAKRSANTIRMYS